MAGVAVLLPLGAWAAVTVDPGPATTVVAEGRVGAAGIGSAAVLDEPGPTTTVQVVPPVTIPPLPAVPTSIRQRPVDTTSPRRTTTTTAASRPGPTTTTVPVRPPGNIAPASSWRAEVPGLSIRVRIEPERPIAGQTVRFRVDVTSVDRCCHLFVNPGDDQMWILHNQLACTFEHELTPGAHTFTFDHTYAEPGAYLAQVQIHDGSMCEPFPATGPPFRHIEMPACIAVGPGPAEITGCAPLSDRLLQLPPAMRTPPNT